MRLLIAGRNTVVLNPDSKLYSRHVSKRSDAALGDGPVAEVTKHPTQDVYGLRNLAERQWFATPSGASTARPVAQHQSITLLPGTRIDFGALDAVVE
jgi:hypothetical protein